MACYRLMQLRAEEALEVERPVEDFSKILRGGSTPKRVSNPFINKNQGNPFANRNNPFGL